MAAPLHPSAAAGADGEQVGPLVDGCLVANEDAPPQAPLVLEADDENDLSVSTHLDAFSDPDAASLSILALQHRVALLKARTLQHQQLIADMRRREQELEVSILRRQLAQLREQVSDRAEQLTQLRHRCRLVSDLAASVNRVMETRTALASGNFRTLSMQLPANSSIVQRIGCSCLPSTSRRRSARSAMSTPSWSTKTLALWALPPPLRYLQCGSKPTLFRARSSV
jgi:hypothetical protein